MSKVNIVGIFTLIFTLLPGLVFAEDVIDDSKKNSYLYVISGTSGALDGDTLTLYGVPNVLYFSDRPVRKAGHISLENLIESWAEGIDSFKADPPNAVLSILNESGTEISVIELQDPTVEENKISFKVKILQGRVLNEFKGSSLFIDYNTGIGNSGSVNTGAF